MHIIHPNAVSRSYFTRIGALERVAAAAETFSMIIQNIYQLAAQAIPNPGFTYSFATLQFPTIPR